jgi:endonuclease YncB( thermonuclease family)
MRAVVPRSAVTLALLFLGALFLQPSTGSCLVFETFQGRVVTVKDGDSIVVQRGGKEVQVRFNGVDAPEKGQAFGTYEPCAMCGGKISDTMRS